jgi:hypothetical protein
MNRKVGGGVARAQVGMSYGCSFRRISEQWGWTYSVRSRDRSSQPARGRLFPRRTAGLQAAGQKSLTLTTDCTDELGFGNQTEGRKGREGSGSKNSALKTWKWRGFFDLFGHDLQDSQDQRSHHWPTWKRNLHPIVPNKIEIFKVHEEGSYVDSPVFFSAGKSVSVPLPGGNWPSRSSGTRYKV